MGHINIDLSAANERHQDRILARDARSPDPVAPAQLDHFWRVVWGYREHDIRETGNAHRFDRDHPWVAKEFEEIERKLSLEVPPPSLWCPPPGQTVTTTTPPPPPVGVAAVPEPSGVLLLALGLALVACRPMVRRPTCRAR
jgi:hypothetical protein